MEVHSGTMENHPGAKLGNHKVVDDPFGEFTDLCSLNQYPGGYDGTPEKIDRTTWSIKYNKPVVISEFGADAKSGMHGDPLTRFGEEYQADVLQRTLPMLDKIPGFSGCTPWILADYRSPRRALPSIQDGWNLKVVIGHNGEKKMAYDVLKKFYGAKAVAGAIK